MFPEQLLAKVVLPSALSVEGGQEPSLEPLSLLQVKVRSLASNCQNPSMPVSAITSLSKDQAGIAVSVSQKAGGEEILTL